MPTMIQFGNGASAPLHDINAVVHVVAALITGENKLPGTPPDVAFAVGSTYHDQAAQAFYEDLIPYAARDKALDVNDVIPFWLEAGKFRGKRDRHRGGPGDRPMPAPRLRHLNPDVPWHGG